MKETRLRPLEWIMIILGGGISAASAALYFSGANVQQYIFGSQFSDAEEQVGVLENRTSGTVRRKKRDDNAFVEIPTRSALYNMDTLVTGPDVEAEVQLSDGSTIELKPKTMIKLVFETQITFSGISRNSIVDLVSGEVSGRAKTTQRKIILRSREKEVAVPVVVAPPPPPPAPRTVVSGVPSSPVPAPPPPALPKQTLVATVQPRTVVPPKPSPLPTRIVIVDPPPPPLKPMPIPVAVPSPVAPRVIRVSPTPSPTPTPVQSPTPEPSETPTPEASATPTPSPTPSPSPSPSPVLVKRKAVLRVLTPRQGAQFRQPVGAQAPKLVQEITYAVDPPDLNMQIRVLLKNATGAPEEVFNEKPLLGTGKGSASVELTKFGSYQVELRTLEDERVFPATVTSEFTFNPGGRSIELLEPLVGGIPLSKRNNTLSERILRNFDITIRWKPVPGITKYKIDFFENETSTKIQRSVEVTGESFITSEDRVQIGALTYQISGKMSSGFTFESKKNSFKFSFPAPGLSRPSDRKAYTQTELEGEDRRVLFTWQKVDFATHYDLEIARDAGFQDIVSSQKGLKENLFFWKNPGPGSYTWRVRAWADKVSSPTSKPFQLTVSP